MSKTWVQGIVIQNGMVLFALAKDHHYFIGGFLEEDEMPEQGVLRELREKVNVDGTILFRLDESVNAPISFSPHITFLVEIGDQVPVLSHDQEQRNIAIQDSDLSRIEFIPLDKYGAFTSIDIRYFELLMADCEKREAKFPWDSAVRLLIQRRTE